jgi:hypothetical protein
VLSAGVWGALLAFQRALAPRGLREVRVHAATSNGKEIL